MPINTSGFGFADNTPVNTGGGYQPVRAGALSAINPGSFALDLVTPFVTGIKGAQSLLAPLAEGITKIAEYNRPENVAAREAEIAKANATSKTAGPEADFRIAGINAETPLLGKRAGFESDKIDNEQPLLPLRAEAEKASLGNQVALANTMNDFYKSGGGEKMLNNKLQEADNATKEIAFKNKQLDLAEQQLSANKELAPQELQFKRDQLAKDREQLKMQQDQIDQMKSLVNDNLKSPQAGQSTDSGGTLTGPLNRSTRFLSDEERMLGDRMEMATGGKMKGDKVADMIHYRRTGTAPYSKEQQAEITNLNDKFRANETVKNVDEAASALSRINEIAGDSSGSSDLQLVDLMNQIVNKPGIKVTEGNVDLIKGTVPGTSKLNPSYWGNKATTGAFLTPEIRAQFKNMANRMVGASISSVSEGPLKSFRAQAERAGLDPQDIAPDFDRYSGGFSKGKTGGGSGGKTSGKIVFGPNGNKFEYIGVDPSNPGHSLYRPVK